MIELLFQLEPEGDDWPPAAVEGLLCDPQNRLFRVGTCPFFVKGLSVGDIVDVQQDEHDQVTKFNVVDPSQNSTVWIIFWDESKCDGTLEQLRSLGCDTAKLAELKPQLCTVNVPASISMTDVDAVLQPLEMQEQIAVAYASYRHSDG